MRTRLSGSVQAAALLAVLAALGAPLDAVAAPSFCIGGADVCGSTGFQICHLREGGVPVSGDICWSAPNDQECRRLQYVLTVACPAVAGGPAAAQLGSGSSLIASAIGGFNIFYSQIARRAVTRQAAADLAAAAAAESAGAAGEKQQRSHFTDIVTAYEREQWKLDGDNGHTDGVRFGWQRQGESGGLYGLSGSYQRSLPDGASSTSLFNANLDGGRSFGGDGIWKATVHGAFSDFTGATSQTLYGGGGQLYFNKSFEGGAIFSGGVILQYLGGNHLPENVQTVSYGLAYGFPLGQRFAVDLDAFGAHILKPSLTDENFYTLGGMLSAYLTSHFSLTLGYRALEGIHGLTSNTFTLGASSRW